MAPVLYRRCLEPLEVPEGSERFVTVRELGDVCVYAFFSCASKALVQVNEPILELALLVHLLVEPPPVKEPVLVGSVP